MSNTTTTTTGDVVTGTLKVQQPTSPAYRQYDSTSQCDGRPVCPIPTGTDLFIKCNPSSPLGNYKQVCSPVDPSRCPVLNGVSASSAQWDSSLGPPNISCTYPLSVIDSFQNITDWTNSFSTASCAGQNFDNCNSGANQNCKPCDSTQSYNFSIMPKWCTEEVTTCPTNPDNPTENLPTCPRFISTDAGGVTCQQWAEQMARQYPTPGQNPADIAKRSFCALNPDSPECGCVGRSYNPIYPILKAGNSFNDGCWWIPCTGTSPSILVTTDISTETCPTTVCQAIINNFDNSGLSLNDVQQYVTCPLQGSGGGGSGGNNPTDEGNVILNAIKKYWWVVGIILFAIVLALVLFVIANNHGKKEKALVGQQQTEQEAQKQKLIDQLLAKYQSTSAKPPVVNNDILQK